MIDRLKSELDKKLAQYRLDGARDVILASAQLSFHILRGSKTKQAPVGASRIGGDPDLPGDAEWPTHAMPEGIWEVPAGQIRRANFLAQIDLADVAAVCPSDLPPTGLLSIFVTEEWGAASPVLLALRHWPPAARLARRSPPEDLLPCNEYMVDLVPHRLSFEAGLSHPIHDPAYRAALAQRTPTTQTPDGHPEHGIDRLSELIHEMRPRAAVGQLLGHALAHDDRDNLYRQVAFGRLGRRSAMYADAWKSMEELEQSIATTPSFAEHRADLRWLLDNAPTIAAEAGRWRLLFRFETDFDVNLQINDADPIFGFIPSDNLAAANFTDAVGEVLQG